METSLPPQQKCNAQNCGGNNTTELLQQQQFGAGCSCCRRRRAAAFTISPIDGMEWMQKCYPTYASDGDMSAKRFLAEKKLTLSRRFQLIERGYVLKLKNGGEVTVNGAYKKQRQNGRCAECGCVSWFDQLNVRLITAKMMEEDNEDDDEEQQNQQQNSEEEEDDGSSADGGDHDDVDQNCEVTSQK